MTTKEEAAAAEKAAAEAKEAAEKAAKDAEEEAAKKAAEEKSFEAWLSKQPKDVQERYNENTAGLKSALDKERQASKEAQKANRRLAELEAEAKKRADAELSELEKAKKESAELKARVVAAERRELQRKVAEKVKLPSAFAERIQGDNEDDMEIDAAAMLAAMPVPIAPRLNTTNPGQPQTGEAEADKRRRLGLD